MSNAITTIRTYAMDSFGGVTIQFSTTAPDADYNYTVYTDTDTHPIIGKGYPTEDHALKAMRAVLKKYDTHGIGASGMVREAFETGARYSHPALNK